MTKPINHEEAYELAQMKQDESNLARCYLAMKEERGAALADARRYRWLRDGRCPFFGVVIKEGPDDHGWFPTIESNLDEAIDAALAEVPLTQDQGKALDKAFWKQVEVVDEGFEEDKNGNV
jgi:hypothetical protein